MNGHPINDLDSEARRLQTLLRDTLATIEAHALAAKDDLHNVPDHDIDALTSGITIESANGAYYCLDLIVSVVNGARKAAALPTENGRQ